MYKKSSSRPGADKGFKGKSDRPAANFDKKPFKRKEEGERGSFSKRRDEGPREDKPFRKREEGSGERSFDKPRRKFEGNDRPAREDKPFRKREEGSGEKSFDKPRRKFEGNDRPAREDKPFRKREEGSGERSFDKPRRKFEGNDRPAREDKPFRKREEGSGERSFDKPRRKFEGNDRPAREDKPFRKREEGSGERSFDKPRRKFEGNDRPAREDKPFRKREEGSGERSFDKPRRKFEGNDRPSRDEKPFRKREGERDDKPRKKFADNDPFNDRDERGKGEKPAKREPTITFKKELEDHTPRYKKGDMATKKPFAGMPERKKSKEEYKNESRVSEKEEFKKAVKNNDREYFGDDDDWEVEGDKRPKVAAAATYPMPLNKYIAHSGECSRRDAAELVKQGKVKVNGELVTDPGHKVNQDDKITLSGKKLTPQKGLIYVLLNKPKGFITTNEDERGRKTVMDLVANADAGRLFPVGRLDRATTGLILLTNDGNLTQKLSHPSFNIKKVYQVTLDKPLSKADFDKVMKGIELEDGKAEVDEMAYLEEKNEIGLEIHSGKNRIVRRIFESMGYVVEKLDRMMYAGLTKKNLPRGKWRYLNEQEIVLLKHFKS